MTPVADDPHLRTIPEAPDADAEGLPTPLLLLDLDEVGRNVQRLRRAFPGVDLHYAMKCNPHPPILESLRQMGVGFEIASQAELEVLARMGVPPERMLILHPIKAPAFLRRIRQAGADWLAVDCREEVEKVARFAPGSRVLVRVDVSNEGSRLDLSGKFGCPPAEAVALSQFARGHGLVPAGWTIHVGSQCESLATWEGALRTLREVSERATRAGLPPELISLGGGLPVEYTRPTLRLEAIGRLVAEAAPQRFAPGGCRVTIEPGRAVVASAGTLVATVVGLAERGGVNWAYLDVGVYQGLMESLEIAGGFDFRIETGRTRPRRRYRLAGPTCDSVDILPHAVELPELALGQRIRFHATGAYTLDLSCAFNGFAAPTPRLHRPYPYPDTTQRATYALSGIRADV